MTLNEIASADDAVRKIVGEDVSRLLSPVLRPEHAPVVCDVDRLPWGQEPVEVVADRALAKVLLGEHGHRRSLGRAEVPPS